MPHATPEAGTQHTFWLRKHASMLKRWWGWGRRLRLPMERLENTHMKHVVYPGVGRQTQTIGNLAHTFQHLERSCVARPELAAGAWCQ
jgi:hypothetical protein